MDNPQLFIVSLMFAIAIVAMGERLGKWVPGLRRLAMPGAVLGGLLGLLLSPQLLSPEVYLPARAAAEVGSVFEMVARFPALFINLVFACIVLGKPLDSLREVWQRARPHVVMGHLTAWGQYVVGLGLTVLVLSPLLSVNECVGVAIAIGFQGGHGTAAGLQASFQEVGFPHGQDIAYAVATAGVLAGTLLGPALARELRRRHAADESDETTRPDESAAEQRDEDHAAPSLTGQLTLHLAIVVLTIGLGWLLLQGMQYAERSIRSSAEVQVTRYIPMFSVVLLCSFVVQLVLQVAGWGRAFQRSLFEKLGAFGLDMVIASALMSLSLKTVGEYWVVIAVLSAVGIAWNLVVLFGFGPRLFSSRWDAYALGDFGGATATTATGLLLIRTADPDKQTDAMRSYSEKQPFYEPFMGGGLVTATALPLVAALGAWTCLAITGAIVAGWFLYAFHIRTDRKHT